MPGAMSPGFYNHNYQILQTPDYVAISGRSGMPVVGSTTRTQTIDSESNDLRFEST